MSVRMRHTKAHTANRRSHHGLVEPRLSLCSNCGGSHMRHKVCENCGQYRGRIVIDVAAKLAKKEKKAKVTASVKAGAASGGKKTATSKKTTSTQKEKK